MSYISVEHLTKEIGNDTVLKDVTLSLEKREIIGLEGQNGSGKTMLMRAVCGLIKPTQGYVSIENKKLWDDIDFPPSVGLLLEKPALLSSYSGRKNLEILSSIKQIASEQDIDAAIEKVGLDPKDKRPVRKYSLGMKQRLGIAMAFFEQPDLIILDEPTKGLDAPTKDAVVNLLSRAQSEGATIVIATHDMQLISRVADNVSLVFDGQISLTEPTSEFFENSWVWSVE